VAAKKYDTTVARIAGNLLSGFANSGVANARLEDIAIDRAVRIARSIVTEVERTEPKEDDSKEKQD
jgi:hypothetical protein